MAKRKTKKEGVGFGVIAGVAAAAAAGAYYLYGPQGAKHRKQVRGWMLKAKGEVMEKAEKLKEIDKKQYEKLVADVVKKYKRIKSIDNKDIDKLGMELKKHWSVIEKEAKKGMRKGKMAVKRQTRKPAGKTTRKRTTTKKRTTGRKK